MVGDADSTYAATNSSSRTDVEVSSARIAEHLYSNVFPSGSETGSTDVVTESMQLEHLQLGTEHELSNATKHRGFSASENANDNIVFGEDSASNDLSKPDSVPRRTRTTSTATTSTLKSLVESVGEDDEDIEEISRDEPNSLDASNVTDQDHQDHQQ